MFFRIDHSSTMSLAEQVAAQVRVALRDGKVEPGERLPPVRALAKSLGINSHTVLRAYTLLREDGILEIRQGRGAWIREDSSVSTVRVGEIASSLISEAHRAGLTHAELLRIVNRAGQA